MVKRLYATYIKLVDPRYYSFSCGLHSRWNSNDYL